MEKLSVVIPIHDPGNTLNSKIIRCVQSVVNQEALPNEIVLTANHHLSCLSDIKKIVNGKSELKFFMNDSNNAAANLNYAINCAEYEIIKILFQDDFLSHSQVISSLKKIFDTDHDCSWIISGSTNHDDATNTRIRRIIPRYSEQLRNGKNYLGCPSTVTLLKGHSLPFLESLIYMFDCEWYLRMCHNFGPPRILRDSQVNIGIHGEQATNWAKAALGREIDITRSLHSQKENKFKKFKLKSDNKCLCTYNTTYG